jgi:ABC-type sugar transport system ATPase subunit
VSATLRFDNIGKVFPGVRALDGVSFDVNVGQVHGLMGENGAGKSTLLKILGGEYQPDSGRVMIDGNEVRFASAASSIAAGIAVIHQELQYVPDLTVAEPNASCANASKRWAWRSIRTPSCVSSRSRNARWSKSAKRCCVMRA